MVNNLKNSLIGQTWKVNRAKALQLYLQRNREILSGQEVGEAVAAALKDTYRRAGAKTEAEYRRLMGMPATGTSATGFAVNDKRLDALIAQMQKDAARVEVSAYRMMHDVYRKTLTQTQFELGTGLYTLDESIDRATEAFLKRGINSVEYRNGARYNIASWAEMALRTSNRRATLLANGATASRLGVFTVSVSQYGACSETCLPWQGRIYWDDTYTMGAPKNTTDYPELSAAVSAGLFHPNCRHTKTLYIPGLSAPPTGRTTADVKALQNSRLEEQQRYNERQIRKYKRLQEGSVAPANKEKYGLKVRQWQAAQRNLINEHPEVLRRDYDREQLRGKRVELPPKANSPPQSSLGKMLEDTLNPGAEKGIIDNNLFPQEIAGVPRGEPMTFDRANHLKPNPNLAKGGGYRINCQSCVVSYEARLRGYDVETLPNLKGSKLGELARTTNLAWIDPATGTHPTYIYDTSITTAKKFGAFLEQTIEQNNRYTLEFAWRGRSAGGHVISVDRLPDGRLRFYDPQIGRQYTDQDIPAYLGRLKFETTLHGTKYKIPPKILRVDDKGFNLDMVKQIMKGSE